jgi:hypothetical protein
MNHQNIQRKSMLLIPIPSALIIGVFGTDK